MEHTPCPLSGYVGDNEVQRTYLLKDLFRVFTLVEFTFGATESGVAVNGFEFPVLFGLEILNLSLSVHHKGQSGSLHTSDGEYPAAVAAAVLQGVESGGIHAEQPVAYGTAESGLISESKAF